MKTARIGLATAALSLIALASGAVPAFGSGFTLSLSAPSTPVVGKPMVLEATGTIPVQYIPYLYWFSLDAIPTSVTTTCPEDRWESAQFATANGGTIVVLSQRERPDAQGHFRIPVAVTPSAPGTVLLCAYTDDGETLTLASTSLILDIRSAGSTPRRTGPAAIANEAAETIRGCRALLRDPSPCVQRAIRRANGRCRRLPSTGRRAACLRAVRRVSGTPRTAVVR